MKNTHTEIANIVKEVKIVPYGSGKKMAIVEVVTTEYNKAKNEDMPTYLTLKCFIPGLVDKIESLKNSGGLEKGQTIQASFRIDNESVTVANDAGDTFKQTIPQLKLVGIDVVGIWMKSYQEAKKHMPSKDAKTTAKPAPVAPKAPVTPVTPVAPEVPLVEEPSIFDDLGGIFED